MHAQWLRRWRTLKAFGRVSWGGGHLVYILRHVCHANARGGRKGGEEKVYDKLAMRSVSFPGTPGSRETLGVAGGKIVQCAFS